MWGLPEVLLAGKLMYKRGKFDVIRLCTHSLRFVEPDNMLATPDLRPTEAPQSVSGGTLAHVW